MKKLRPIDYSKTRILGGFWREKQDLVRSVTVRAVYDRFKETGRIDAFKFKWRPGDDKQPHFYWDSDVAKWIEGVAYMLREAPDHELEALAEEIIADVLENQGEDGYFNIYFTVVAPDKRYTDRNLHELYCAGHLMEAAVAWYETTGKREFLDAMCRYADYIDLRFRQRRDTAFRTSGHEEIELALFRLWRVTGEKKYFELAEFFLNERGPNEKGIGNAPLSNIQAHLPLREQRTAEGHAVRAGYIYSAMADYALETGEPEMTEACKALFDSIYKRRMYITGGVGSSAYGEAFTVDYDLPNIMAYSESCAAIALAFFANRMLSLEPDSKYSDTVERVLYNGFLSSTSQSGDRFFYVNPLELVPRIIDKDVSSSHAVRMPMAERQRVFRTSCCPPNVVRFAPSIGNLIYGDNGDTLFVHQYIDSETSVEREGRTVTLRQITDFPRSGRVTLTSDEDLDIALRIPYWHKKFKGKTVKGYTYFTLRRGEEYTIDLDLTPRFVSTRPESIYNTARAAVMRGPVVYCSEEVDNGKNLRDLRLDPSSAITVTSDTTFGIPALEVAAYRSVKRDDDLLYYDGIPELEEVTARFIPYYAFANRGICEMLVWHNLK